MLLAWPNLSDRLRSDWDALLENYRLRDFPLCLGAGLTAAWEIDVASVYESQAAAEAAASQVQAVWSNLADLLVGPPNAEVYENVVHITA